MIIIKFTGSRHTHKRTCLTKWVWEIWLYDYIAYSYGLDIGILFQCYSCCCCGLLSIGWRNDDKILSIFEFRWDGYTRFPRMKTWGLLVGTITRNVENSTRCTSILMNVGLFEWNCVLWHISKRKSIECHSNAGSGWTSVYQRQFLTGKCTEIVIILSSSLIKSRFRVAFHLFWGQNEFRKTNTTFTLYKYTQRYLRLPLPKLQRQWNNLQKLVAFIFPLQKNRTHTQTWNGSFLFLSIWRFCLPTQKKKKRKAKQEKQ